jgi:hypothetical protein
MRREQNEPNVMNLAACPNTFSFTVSMEFPNMQPNYEKRNIRFSWRQGSRFR